MRHSLWLFLAAPATQWLHREIPLSKVDCGLQLQSAWHSPCINWSSYLSIFVLAEICFNFWTVTFDILVSFSRSHTFLIFFLFFFFFKMWCQSLSGNDRGNRQGVSVASHWHWQNFSEATWESSLEWYQQNVWTGILGKQKHTWRNSQMGTNKTDVLFS